MLILREHDFFFRNSVCESPRDAEDDYSVLSAILLKNFFAENFHSNILMTEISFALASFVF